MNGSYLPNYSHTLLLPVLPTMIYKNDKVAC